MSDRTTDTLLASVNGALDDGVELMRWWEEREAHRDYAERFDLRRSFNPAGESFGFFDVAELGNKRVAVQGVVQEMKFDTPKLGPPERMRDQLRQFVLGYFMRVSSVKR